MKIDGLKTVLKTLIKSKTPVTSMIWGQHGVAKSSVVKQIGQELGMPVYDIRLSQKEAVDIAGVLYTFENKALGMSVTAAHPPDWFAEALKKGNCILFLDEFNMGRREVMSAAFELVNDRRLNNLQLPDSVAIVCAGNPNDDRYDVTPMSESLVTRLMHLQIQADAGVWYNWASQPNSGIHPDVAKFIAANPKDLFVQDERDKNFPVEIKYCGRSWERAGLIHALPLSPVLKQECIRGLVGLELSIKFMQAFGNKNVPLDAMEILEYQPGAQDRLREMLTPGKMRIDLLNASAENLSDFCLKNVIIASVPYRIQNVIKFIKALPMDCALPVIKNLMELPGWGEHFESDPQLSKRIASIGEAMNVSKAG